MDLDPAKYEVDHVLDRFMQHHFPGDRGSELDSGEGSDPEVPPAEGTPAHVGTATSHAMAADCLAPADEVHTPRAGSDSAVTMQPVVGAAPAAVELCAGAGGNGGVQTDVSKEHGTGESAGGAGDPFQSSFLIGEEELCDALNKSDALDDLPLEALTAQAQCLDPSFAEVLPDELLAAPSSMLPPELLPAPAEAPPLVPISRPTSSPLVRVIPPRTSPWRTTPAQTAPSRGIVKAPARVSSRPTVNSTAVSAAAGSPTTRTTVLTTETRARHAQPAVVTPGKVPLPGVGLKLKPGGQRKQACLRCHQAKSACDGYPCLRCTRLAVECVFQDKCQKRARPATDADGRAHAARGKTMKAMAPAFHLAHSVVAAPLEPFMAAATPHVVPALPMAGGDWRAPAPGSQRGAPMPHDDIVLCRLFGTSDR